MNAQDIYEWMMDYAPAYIDEYGYVDVDTMVDAAYDLFGDKVEDETYRDRGYDPSDEEQRIDFFAELGSMLGM